nr:ATP-binding protein [Marinicella sp. W31]MDC2876083.1 ATP-binding protein [Marinicella sp. W31]
MDKTANPTFRPRARLLQLLGDQLIGSARLAVFELVKNAYDADASKVDIHFYDLDNPDARIVIRDDGEGMDRETIEEVWLEPGADYRERQRKENKRSARYFRLPLGEKGVGRFAVHKLGTRIELRTRKQDGPEFTVEVDWDSYSQHRYMDQAPVSVIESADPQFDASSSGTQITISGLRETWKRGDIRRLWRNVKSISSPTKSPESFWYRSPFQTTRIGLQDYLTLRTSLIEQCGASCSYTSAASTSGHTIFDHCLELRLKETRNSLKRTPASN